MPHNYDDLVTATTGEQQYLLSAPILRQVLLGEFELQTYRDFLINAYHHVKHTVPLMMAAGARIAPERTEISKAFTEYIEEEYGHERWILQDLAHCGVNSAEIVATDPHFSVEMMVAFVRDYIVQRSPFGFFGMVHVLEGTSTALATQTAELVQRQLQLPDLAFSYLRSHGDLDIAHVAFFQNILEHLGKEEMQHVVYVAKRVYRLYGDVLRSVSTAEVANAA